MNEYRLISSEFQNRDRQREFMYDYDLSDKLTASDESILVKKQFITLQGEPKPDFTKVDHDEIEIIGRKVSCGTVWCKCCFVKKGGSKRFSDRLKMMDYKSTRQVVLTTDPKKFKDGQDCFETLRDSGALHQFIHNLTRTSGVKIKDWAWNLEWHSNGFPHWHMFIETEAGKNGMIGNETILKHWKHGLVYESYIKNQRHWDYLTDYFGNNGYFNPKTSGFDKSGKDKTHQLELPEWAKAVTYKIRKTGSKAGMKKVREDEAQDEKGPGVSRDTSKTYTEILDSCGKRTAVYIRRNGNSLFYEHINSMYVFENPRKQKNTYYNAILNIPYKEFLKKAGDYIDGLGYVVTTSLKDFFVNFMPEPVMECGD